jgi:hypothetical protein
MVIDFLKGTILMRRFMLPILLLASVVSGLIQAAAEEPAPAKIRVLLTYGGHGFDKGPFFAMFAALPDVVYTKAELPEAADTLKPGLEKDFDVLVMYDMVPAISDEQQKAFVALLNRGIGVVSLHHNLDAHKDWPEFRKIIGGKYLPTQQEIGGKTYGPSHYAEGQEINVIVADREHPITAGIDDFQIHDETYDNYYLSPDVRVLLKTDNPKNNPSLAWVTRYGKSRVFYFQLGHDASAWHNPNYPRILDNGIRWAAGR